jgi:hypothetical protein
MGYQLLVEARMQFKSRTGLCLGVATGALALALSGLPVTLDHGSFDGKAAMAAAGGNGKGNGHGNGHANGHGKGVSDDVEVAKAHPAKDKLTKEDAMHPSNLGRLNGFMHASPQALANASPNSAIGKLSQEYRDALLGYSTDGTVTTGELADILAEAANKPLTGEQVVAIHEKLIANNEELADEAVAAQLTDEEFADQLAEEANEIQETETDQGLGNSEDDESDDVADSEDGDEGDGEESEGALADAADAVGDAAVDTADAIGDFFSETF